MKRIIIILLIAFSSCKEDTKTELNFQSTFAMYAIISDEFDDSKIYLVKEIDELMSQIETSKGRYSIQSDCNILTENYTLYLENVIDKLLYSSGVYETQDNLKLLSEVKHSNSFFFNNGSYSKNGNDFIEKTDFYRNSMLQLVTNENLRERISSLYSTQSMLDQNANPIRSLDYYFKDQSLIGTVTYLELRIINALEIEKEFLDYSLVAE